MRQVTSDEDLLQVMATAIDVPAILAYLGVKPSDPRAERMARAMSTAFVHDSYLHENRPILLHVTPGVLRALEAVGKAWVGREFAIRLYLDRRYDGPGRISQLHGSAWRRFESWVCASVDLRSFIHLGQGESRSIVSPQVMTRMMSQVVGALVSVGVDDVARNLLRGFLDSFLDEAEANAGLGVDLTTILPADEQSWSYTKEGPDHDTRFAATLADAKGRSVTGTARSKKSARAAAAGEFIRRHGSLSNVARKADNYRLPKELDMATFSWQRRVAEVVDGFGTGAEWRGLVEQAFVHSSWAYENKVSIERTWQQDNRVLAFVGSHIVQYEYTRAVGRTVLRELPEAVHIATQSGEAIGEAALSLGIGDMLMLGRGQRAQGVERAMVVDAFQALVAALYVAKGAPSELFVDLPEEWQLSGSLMAPGVSREKDARTALQGRCAAVGFDAEYVIVDESGPDHNRFYVAELRLTSGVLEETVAVRGRRLRNVKAARDDAARIVLRRLELVDEPEGGASQQEQMLDRFVAAHLASTRRSRFSSAHVARTAAKAPATSAPRRAAVPALNRVVSKATVAHPRARSSRPSDQSGPAKRLDGYAKHAVDVVRAYYENAGYRVEFAAGVESCNLDVRCGDERLNVKVQAGEVRDVEVVLTDGEAEHFRNCYPNTVLAVVHSIRLVAGSSAATGGVLELTFPWQP
ncbi:hypothetical protein [Rhodococcus kronopolitis]|uniref:Uncharacterized protein n=1 Tax=Rhodococcus kronopolitis TaxID=1460226 RepID=A0ABV9FRG6_9NOCA